MQNPQSNTAKRSFFRKQGAAAVSLVNLRMLGDSEANRGEEVAQDSQQHKAQARQSEEQGGEVRARNTTAKNDTPRSIFEEESGLCLTSEGDKTLESIPRSEARQSPILTKETSRQQKDKPSLELESG